jgi:hypothetical protein
MEPDEQPPWVPAPREGRHDTGWERVGHPVIPAPRPAPSLERLPGAVATLTERPPAPRGTSAAVVLAPRHSTALAVIDLGVPGVLRAWGRVVVRLVHAAVAGVRALVAPVVPAPR